MHSNLVNSLSHHKFIFSIGTILISSFLITGIVFIILARTQVLPVGINALGQFKLGYLLGIIFITSSIITGFSTGCFIFFPKTKRKEFKARVGESELKLPVKSKKTNEILLQKFKDFKSYHPALKNCKEDGYYSNFIASYSANCDKFEDKGWEDGHRSIMMIAHSYALFPGMDEIGEQGKRLGVQDAKNYFSEDLPDSKAYLYRTSKDTDKMWENGGNPFLIFTQFKLLMKDHFPSQNAPLMIENNQGKVFCILGMRIIGLPGDEIEETILFILDPSQDDLEKGLFCIAYNYKGQPLACNVEIDNLNAFDFFSSSWKFFFPRN